MKRRRSDEVEFVNGPCHAQTGPDGATDAEDR